MKKERYIHRLNVQGLREMGISCLEKGKPALLVLDMQDYFLDPESHAFVPSAPELIAPLKKVINTFKFHELPVFFTRHLNTAENAGSMGRWWRDIITEENPLSRINAAFDTPSELIVKSQYDAFLHTNLQDRLNRHAVTSVVVTGVMTNLCCETTARAAFTRGYDVVFPVDCTAAYNMALHNATILNLAHGFALPACGEAVTRTLTNAC